LRQKILSADLWVIGGTDRKRKQTAHSLFF
jgi:hypothetical protein